MRNESAWIEGSGTRVCLSRASRRFRVIANSAIRITRAARHFVSSLIPPPAIASKMTNFQLRKRAMHRACFNVCIKYVIRVLYQANLLQSTPYILSSALLRDSDKRYQMSYE
jgi:hypothetical protein